MVLDFVKLKEDRKKMEKQNTMTELGNNSFLISKGEKECMVIKDEKPLKVNYIIIKIGDKIYSTKFGEKQGTGATIKKSITKGIGEETYLRIRDLKFVETNKHQEIEPLPFEVDLYLDEELIIK